MKRQAFWALALLLRIAQPALLMTSCTAQAQSPSPTPTAVPSPASQIEIGSSRQRLTLKLTLSSPDDLLVQQGDRVKEGQPLSDRVRDRVRLEGQKRQLQLQIDRLNRPVSGPPPAQSVPEVAGLPPASFLDEVAAVERQKVTVAQAEMAVANQQRMLDMFASMPEENLPQATIPHETERLKQKQQELDAARAEFQLAEAKLAQAQQERQYQEYQHSLEMSKRAIAIQQAQLQRAEQFQRQQEQERERSFQLAQLAQQMQQLDTQLAALSTVRSPYSGTIQRIRWEGQNDQNLVVQLVLVADGGPSGGSASDADGRSSAGNGTD